MSILKNAMETKKLFRQNKGECPTFLIYEVTKKCNSKCIMCHIWKNKTDTDKELKYNEINKIFSQKFFKNVKYLNLSGGEPFIKKDLKETIIEFIKTLDKMTLIGIATNGFLTDKIKKDVLGVLDFIKEQKRDIKLSVTVSIDGPEKIHNKMRGVKIAYRSATKTFKELKKLEQDYPNLTIGIETVICKYNIDQIEKIYEAHKKLTKHLNFVPAIQSSFFANQGMDFAISQENLPKLIRFYKRIIKETPHLAYFYDKAIYFLTKHRRNFPCLGGFLTARVDAYGNLYPCLMSNYIVAKKGQDFLKEWNSEKMIEYRKKRDNICKRCLSNCDIINNYYYEFFNAFQYYATHPRVSLKLAKMIMNDYINKGYYAKMISR